jgi:hypothetical protein
MNVRREHYRANIGNVQYEMRNCKTKSGRAHQIAICAVLHESEERMGELYDAGTLDLRICTISKCRVVIEGKTARRWLNSHTSVEASHRHLSTFHKAR